ncbi:MAG: hypothetical protein ACKOWC_00300, partial [Limnohabitans sp.]
GGKGHDILFATDKGDTLIGGKGQDLMFAGFGEDTFEFGLGDLDGNVDIIVGFNAEQDVICLDFFDLSKIEADIDHGAGTMMLEYDGKDFLQVYFAAPLSGDIGFDDLVSGGVISGVLPA